MEKENHKLLEKILYDMANKIIGWVGNPSDQFKNELGEEFIEVAIYFTDPIKLIKKWEVWITAYQLFAKYKFTGKVSDVEKMVKIYWRYKPEIVSKDGKNILYARLLLSHKTEYTELK